MTTPSPDPDDPAGTRSPLPSSGGSDSEALLDAGATEDAGSALGDMGDAAQEGDARLAMAEESTDTGGPDALSPAARETPVADSAGRGESAGHQQGGASTTGR